MISKGNIIIKHREKVVKILITRNNMLHLIVAHLAVFYIGW